MSRELRMVAEGWRHPENDRGEHVALFDGKDYDEHYEWWEKDGEMEKPDPENYMPRWTEDEKTLFQMYETVSEGTPISPAMPTKEALAEWLADNGANAGAGDTATYDEWLACIEEGSSLASFIMHNGEFINGVAAISRNK